MPLQFSAQKRLGFPALLPLLAALLPCCSSSLRDSDNSSRNSSLNYDCATQKDLPLKQCKALVAVYEHTGGESWKEQGGWGKNSPSRWTGVQVQDNTVIGLKIPNNGLKGSIPREIGDLADLRSLNLLDNQLTGKVPTTIDQLTQLEYLNLSNNELEGTISLPHLTKLETLYLEDNRLEGSLAQFSHLQALEVLDVSENRFSGEIPKEFAAFSRLETFDLTRNELSGPIPDELSKLTGVGFLSILCGNKGLTSPSAAVARWLANEDELAGSILSDPDMDVQLRIEQAKNCE